MKSSFAINFGFNLDNFAKMMSKEFPGHRSVKINELRRLESKTTRPTPDDLDTRKMLEMNGRNFWLDTSFIIFSLRSLSSSIFIARCSKSDNLYGDNIGNIFPGRADGRSATEQGLYQLAALGTTLAISILSGLLTGKIVKTIANEPEKYFDDEQNWGYEELETTEPNTEDINPENRL